MDTNALISAALIGDSANAKAFDKVLREGVLAFSEPTFLEFMEVLYRPKFDKYLSDEKRSGIIAVIEQNAKRFAPTETITSCADPDDNIFLELALAANAACIITGDKKLQLLHPLRGVSIINAADFLLRF